MTKYNVLAILKRNNDYTSGEEISKLLGVTRAAINLSIKALRQEGYDISSSTKKGYLLKNNPDILNEGEFINTLGLERTNKIIIFDTIDSTNNYLKKSFSSLDEGSVILANKQTQGRGRMGRSFVSNEDGIYMSYLLKPKCNLEDVTSITAWTAVAVNNAIEKIYAKRTNIKWVNDLVMNKKKICGILSEMAIESENLHIQYIIVGIGINVNNKGFDDSINNIASSLYLETKKEIKRVDLISEIIKEMDILVQKWPYEKKVYYDKYVNDDITCGKEIRIIKGLEEHMGLALRINEDFSLTVKIDNVEEKLNSGEISIKGIYDYI